MQAARCPALAPAGTRSSGSISRHSGMAIGQRGLKRQPGGIFTGFGVSPRRISGWAVAREERLRVGVLGVVDDLAGRSFLHDAAEVHDRDPVGEVGGRREVVRDHEDAQPALPQLVEEREDAGPHRHVQHRDGLVGDQQLGVEYQAGRDRHALALPTRELVRVAVEEELRRRQPCAVESIAHQPVAAALAVALAVDDQRLLDSRPNSEPRVERLVRVLEDELDAAPQAAQVTPGAAGDVLAEEADRPRLRLDQPQDRLRCRRLAAPRFADQREELSPADAERDAVDGPDGELRAPSERSDHAARDRESCHEAFDLEQGRLAVRAHVRRRPSWPGRSGGMRPRGPCRWRPAAAWSGCRERTSGRSAARTGSRPALDRAGAVFRGWR